MLAGVAPLSCQKQRRSRVKIMVGFRSFDASCLALLHKIKMCNLFLNRKRASYSFEENIVLLEGFFFFFRPNYTSILRDLALQC